ncbi:DNA-binding transcriptional regulator, MerR family [Nocardiopsis flavescens]|uniref:DNA-binding transcriptional regulator, MerR family n=1 Tax=Nocardiopsis flavescens TaxID=758803 RepID=A0A1M6G9L0_9ACTN|nr:MerR family transcriptional regulator [Nocardiopsis flavescens]SHJ06665.1 DNA-binding transcriptional regulator, MerR family [Nocardiopsis flavescens]
MRSSSGKPRVEELSIGDLAAEFGLGPHVLRHWEAMGVLEPVRRVGGRRRYSPGQRLRVALVLGAQDAGMSLDRIRDLAGAGADRRGAALTEHLAELDERLERLRAAREMVAHAVACESGDVLECPNLRRMLEEAVESGCHARRARGTAPKPPERPAARA